MDGEDGLMSDWKDRLADVDDDYLIGISNKGIVKRAYKDKEESEAEVLSLGEEAVVKVGGETVTVRFPLGESGCSCPSRSICRHVVQAVLTLKESVQGTADSPDRKESVQGTADSPDRKESVQGTADSPDRKESVQGTADSPDMGESAQETSGGFDMAENVKGDTAKGAMSGQGEEGNLPSEKEPEQTGASMEFAASEKILREIDGYPLQPLKKALGNRQFQNFVGQVLSGIRPRIRYASTVTIYLPGRESEAGAVVKLLSPLEYSSCTCHKKELCAHKAAAILWCRLETGKLTGEELTGEAAGEPAYDMDRVQEAAGQMRQFLEEVLATGLSRTSPDVLDHMERLAVLAHNAGLARFEGYFRGLFTSYEGYFKRKAAFQTEELMGQITRLYRRVRLLQQAGSSMEVKQYAGEFRADYVPVGRLDLIGIGLEHFDSGTGYEGETVYFLEENTKKWYTYTNARPVFYEKGRRRKFTEKAQAPWGLGISMEELLKVRISLTGAKCDDRGRLSASQDTRGEITGEQRLSLSDIEGWYYRDFGKLFSEQIGKRRKAWLAGGSSQEAAELVFVQPAARKAAEFSQTGQLLSMALYDEAEREVTIEVAYSKEEAGTIRYLEKLSEQRLPCFAGKVYLKEGRLRMYPVAMQDTFFEG